MQIFLIKCFSVDPKVIFGLICIIVIGLTIPQDFLMPVQNASNNDFNQESFWYYPWGKSGVHKGVDIFASKGTDVKASVSGFVIYTGEIDVGGKIVLILGPKWRIHYYAHLDEIASGFGWISRDNTIGTVGNSGNAIGKPAHLHYSILTLIPHVWRIDSAPQGWKKMFYLNPVSYLNSVSGRG